MDKDKGIFPGWWVVLGGFLLCFIGIGIGINAIGVFFKPVVTSLGFKRGDFSLYFTIAALVMTFFAPVIGKLLEKIDIRIVMGICTALMSGSFMLYSRCNTLTCFYIVSIVAGIGHAGSHIIPVTMAISNWFDKKRGIAMGIVFTGTGLGGLVFNPLGNWLILTYGWRQAYITLGGIMAIICIPVAVLLMRLSPTPYGLYPDGKEKKEGLIKGIPSGLTLSESMRYSPFWLIVFMVFLLNILNMGIQQHLIPYLTDLGHSSTFAANIMALYLGMTILGKLSLGHLCDKKGLRSSFGIFMVILTIGIALLYRVEFIWIAIVFGIIYGFANSVQTVIPPLMTARCVGLRHYGVIFGVVSIFTTLGSGIGMPLTGYIYDWTGSYNLAFATYIVFSILVAIAGIKAMALMDKKGNAI
ncbi:MAG: MFS transporter [Deltaproteobacteria bacterium]|nr:MFS transporter [Deltaproteobacteria bacterium]